MIKFGKIRIVKAPEGEAPADIKKAWIGVEILCLYKSKKAKGLGALTSKAVAYEAFLVLQSHAIDSLEQVSPEAARWWRVNGFPQEELAVFLFNADSAEEIEPVLDEEAAKAFLN